jgi:hypothetical protein
MAELRPAIHGFGLAKESTDIDRPRPDGAMIQSQSWLVSFS